MWDVPAAERDNLVGLNLSGRRQAGDAGFGLHDTRTWTASFAFDPATMTSTPPITWPSEPAEQAFHDSFGYQPGFFFSPDTGFVYFWDEGASTVLPARGVYSTPITDVTGDPIEEFYGFTVGGFPLGTGNPGDDHVHFGVHAEVLSSTEEYAMVRIWNRPYEAQLKATVDFGGKVTFSVDENIGGKLDEPYLVVGLHEGVEYVDGSAFGGFMPVGGASAEAALAAARAGRLAASADEVKFLVWTGPAIGTGVTAELGGFEVEHSDGLPGFAYELYRNGNVFVQEGHVQAGFAGVSSFMPVIR
jgi:hypothetical protein